MSLGKKLLKNNISFDQTIIGPLNRHQQTFDGIKKGEEKSSQPTQKVHQRASRKPLWQTAGGRSG